jgi:hypothetical protein
MTDILVIMDAPEVEELIRSIRYVRGQIEVQLKTLDSLMSWLELRPYQEPNPTERCGVGWEGARTHANPDLPAHHCSLAKGHSQPHACTCGIIASDNDIKGNAV